MRIAYDHQIFCLQSFGGISRYFASLAGECRMMGEETGVFAPLHKNAYLDELPDGIVHGRRLERYPPKSRPMMLAINRLLSKKTVAAWRPHIVHETYYSASGIVPSGCPSVVTVYDMIHERFREHFAKRDRTSERKRAAVERAAHVICISENTKHDLIERFGVRNDKVSVVHLGFSLFSGNRNIENGERVPQRPFLLHVGIRKGYKNFSTLLRAVASSPRLRSDFDIVAFGSGPFNPEEAALLSKLGYREGQVRHTGGNDAELAACYRSAAAFVYPSLYEGFGLPPLEAMSHRCPVVSSNTSAMPEVVGNAGEYFDPSSAEDMAEAIERVVYSPGRSLELTELGSKRIRHFTWKRCAEKTIDIYRNLVGEQ